MYRALRVPRNEALALLVLFLLLELGLFSTASRALETVSASPISSSGREVIAGTRGDVEVKIDSPGIAVRIEIPREFLKGRSENDTSFLSSDISNDYYYYSLVDASLHYSHTCDAPGYKPDFPPYDPNAPFMAEIWSHDGSQFVEFTPPKHVWMRGLTAPAVAGKYEFLIYVADKVCGGTGAPLFPVNATQTLPITVTKGPLHASVSGFIVDPLTQPMLAIRASGVVYAIDKAGNVVARSFVDSNTGSFNVTGLSEGEYTLEASAGYWKETGYSYMPTRYPEIIRVSRNSKLTLSIPLNRGCIIRGEIKYNKPDGTPISSLSHPAFAGLRHPWSNGVDQVTSLNYTVEALTDGGEVVASFSARSTGLDRDPFILMNRAEIKHVGYPPVGTAYSGLPLGRYTLRAWVFGYVQKTPLVLTVASSSPRNVQINLVTGAAIAGKMSFRNPQTLKPETPRTAENAVFGTLTGTLYGGNILVSAYSSTGQLAAVTLIRGATPNGTTAYADHSSIRFYLLGFSEPLNRTFSGVWKKRDYGIPSGTYSIKVHVRGYRQPDISTVTVSEGSNSTAHITLLREGAVGIVVASSAIISGTSVEVPWVFRDLTPQPYLRVYVYGYGGSDMGYVEDQIGSRTPMTRTRPLNFTGRNCTISEITFQGYLPNSVTEGTYVLKAFTFGYVQNLDAKVTVSSGVAVQTRIQVYPGLNVSGTVWIMAGGLRGFLTEDAEVRIDAYNPSGSMAGTVSCYPNSGASNFNFTMIGLRGVGHFFYVTPNGHRMKDYGIAAGRYALKVHDFGVEWRYRVRRQPTLEIRASGETVYIVAYRMGKVYGKVWGVTPDDTLVPLSWVAVTAGNETSFSADGKYTLHLDEGYYELVFSLPGYLNKSFNCVVTKSGKIERDVNLDPI